MTRLGRAVLRLCAVTTLGVSVLGAAHPASAQPPTDGAAPTGVSIELESATPWVEPDGEWSAELRVSGAPADAKLSYSLRQATTGSETAIRDALIAERTGDAETKVMRSPVSRDLSSLTDAGGTTRLTVPIRGDGTGARDRILVPNRGVYPVVVTVATAAGDALARTTLYLNRLPDPDASADRPDPFRLGLLVRTAHQGGFADDGRTEITADVRNSIAAVTGLAEAAGDLPLQVDVSPESIVALTQSGVPGDLQLIERLRIALGSASVLRVPWADLHLEGWATTGSVGDVRTSLIDGQEALFARLGRRIDARMWPVDTTAGPNGVDLLGRIGVASMVVTPDQLTAARPPSGESGTTRPFRIKGTDSTITAMMLDPTLQTLLDTPTADPVLAAHQLVTQLMGAWLADSAHRGAILDIDDRAEPDVVAELFSVLGGTVAPSDRPISVVDPADVAALAPITVRQSGRDVAWERELAAPADVPRVGGIARRLETARPLVDDYAAIVPAGDAVAAREAIVIQRSLDRRIPTGTQEALLDDAIGALRRDLRGLSASGPKTLTVTSRDTSVPLRFTNDMGRPVRVRLRLQSPRLVFTDGAEQSLTLEPGLNRFDVRIDVRASGQFVMQADLLAPGSDRVLASTRQTIRSRTFSGVGLMLSGGALLFLVIWWSRTLRRRSDGPDDASPDHDSGGASTQDLPPPTQPGDHVEGPTISTSPS